MQSILRNNPSSSLQALGGGGKRTLLFHLNLNNVLFWKYKSYANVDSNSLNMASFIHF